MLIIGLELQLISLEFIIQYLKAYVILVYVLRSTPDRIAPPPNPPIRHSHICLRLRYLCSKYITCKIDFLVLDPL